LIGFICKFLLDCSLEIVDAYNPLNAFTQKSKRTMKNLIRNILLSFLSFTFPLLVFCQSGSKFYASFEDFKNGNPISGYEVEEYYYGFGGKESLRVKTSEGTEKLNVSKLPSEFFIFRNFLNRVYNKSVWIVLAEGKLCYYSSMANNEDQGYSDGIHGEIHKFKDSFLEKYLAQYHLLEAYKKDKPRIESHTTKNENFNNLVDRNVKYFKLLNEKME
jgi:hypothetical protein